MGAEFHIAQCTPSGGSGLNITGSVSYGEVREGSIGRTFRGKRFTLVKIVKEGLRIPKAFESDQVALFLKNITQEDIKAGEIIYFD